MSESQEDIKRAAQIDRLLSKANVHRMREEFIQAEDVLREALGVDGARDDVHELLGDILYARGQLDGALDEFKTASEGSSPRVSAETKYAKVVLEIGEREHDKLVALEMLENPHKYAEPPKHPLLAFILSGVAPGVGQIYNGQRMKGGIILGVMIFGIILLGLLKNEVQNLLKVVGSWFNPVPMAPPPVGWLAALVGFLLMFLWIYAVIDAVVTSSKGKAKSGEG